LTLADLPADRAGTRLHGRLDLARRLDATTPLGGIAASALGPGCFPVRAILFDKNEATNWALGWHQDRTIAVRERRPVAGFGPWTMKSGMTHVAPPVATLEHMVTLRLHLDPVSASNAPLLVARGSHRLGMVAEAEIDRVVGQAEVIACLADRGDVWLYRTLILHASAAAMEPRRRRVLQVDYAAQALPDGLEFLGL
jgi:ectoine hydroxylase-related dioxygenase (phytanoyl-CoA dioxygenase family)